MTDLIVFPMPHIKGGLFQGLYGFLRKCVLRKHTTMKHHYTDFTWLHYTNGIYLFILFVFTFG